MEDKQKVFSDKKEIIAIRIKSERRFNKNDNIQEVENNEEEKSNKTI